MNAVIIQTTCTSIKAKSKIKELHSYDVPEIIQIDITNAREKNE